LTSLARTFRIWFQAWEIWYFIRRSPAVSDVNYKFPLTTTISTVFW
jgi:hypothetical protein